MEKNKMGNIFRLAAGGYLVYLGIQLIMDAMEQKPSNEMFIIIMSTIFAVVGAFFAVYALKNLFFPKNTDQEEISDANADAQGTEKEPFPISEEFSSAEPEELEKDYEEK